MRKLILIIAVVFGLVLVGQDAWAGTQKVSLCHFDAVTGEKHDISIAVPAVPAHLEHGDFDGTCQEELACANPAREYMSRDTDLCPTLSIICSPYQMLFMDFCGCGCQNL